MASITLADAATGLEPSVRRGYVKTLIEESPIAKILPFKEINGPGYQWHEEDRLPTVTTRNVGGSYTSSSGSHRPRMVPLKILGGQVEIDRFILKTNGTQLAEDEKAKQFRLHSVAMSRKLDELFFEGDSDVTPSQPDGLKKMISRDLGDNQLILQASGGGALTLVKLEDLIDAVPGPVRDKHLFMNRFLFRKITRLIDAAGGTQHIEVDKSDFGTPTYSFQGVQIHIMERQEDGSTVLDFDEDPGDGTSDTASIYCIRTSRDESGVFGVTAGGVMPEVEDYGIITPPNHLGFGEWYVAFAVTHPRAAARLYGILES